MSAPGVWPNFFIVGTMRGGTTALYEYLAQHPDVFLPKVKEPHFFSQARDRFSESVHGEAPYLDLFRGATQAAIGEASASYLWSEAAGLRIRATQPEARVIILLRDPIERAHSHYLWEVRNGTEERPLYQALTEDCGSSVKEWGTAHLYVDLGLYHDQVGRYLELFGAAQVLVLLSQDLQRDPLSTLRSVCHFLDIDPGAADSIDSAPRHNRYGAPRGAAARAILKSPLVRRLSRVFVPNRYRKAILNQVLLDQTARPVLDGDSRRFLVERFDADLRALEGLLGRSLPQLRRSWSEVAPRVNA